jgi:hypothetical protein
MACASHVEQAAETDGQREEALFQHAHAILSFTGRNSQSIFRRSATHCTLVIES